MKEMYRKQPSLMEKVVDKQNIADAIKAVKHNKGAAGIDNMSVAEIEEHIYKYYVPLRSKLLDGTYKPQPVKRVEIPKPNGQVRKLGIPVVRDRVIQQAIRQVIEPLIDPHFMENSHGFRPGKGTHSALKQCVKYYEEGYKFVVDCDLKECFVKLNHDKLIHYLEQFIQDKMIIKIIRKFLLAGVIDLSGEFVESKTGAPQGGVLSPLLSNIYLHELDKELSRRGHRFVRYADDFVIYIKSKRAGERVLESVTKFIEKDLKLIVNTAKSQVGSPTHLKFLSCLIHTMNGQCRFIPTKQAKQKFKRTLKRLTSRKRPGTSKEIIQQINRVTRGWINYFGLGFIKTFIQRIEQCLHRRIRQLILKRWKRPKTIIRKLKSYGLDTDSAKRIAYSRKKYWRLSINLQLHVALSTKRLYHWGLVPLNQLVESAYAKY